MFATPKDVEALLGWIERLSGSERAAAYTAAGMAWNLAVTVSQNESEDLEADREADRHDHAKAEVEGYLESNDGVL